MNSNKKLAEHIIEMAEVDQAARFRAAKDSGDKLANFVVYAIDAAHNCGIRRIIAKFGYPNQKLIGKKALRSFWLLVQHQDFDIELQEECLENCDFGAKDKAHLIDRVLVNKGEKQIYGTQFYRNKSGKLALKPVRDKKNLNKLRKSVGLESLKS